jgi:lipopolysaccharide export system protein LptA
VKNALIALAFLLLSCASLVQAERADRNKPTQIEADRASYDDLKQISIWEGNVILTRGTLTLRALRLEMRQDPEGYQYGTAFGSADSLAFFRQKRDVGEQYVEGYAERIDYDSKADKVILTIRATMKRLEGAVVIDEVHGNSIVMDNRADSYSVNSAASNAAPANAGGSTRVRGIIAPRGQSPLGAGAGVVPLKPATEVAAPPAPAPMAPR